MSGKLRRQSERASQNRLLTVLGRLPTMKKTKAKARWVSTLKRAYQFKVAGSLFGAPKPSAKSAGLVALQESRVNAAQ
jgi:hypothetical protein